jgi:hypothetical protein
MLYVYTYKYTDSLFYLKCFHFMQIVSLFILRANNSTEQNLSTEATSPSANQEISLLS